MSLLERIVIMNGSGDIENYSYDERPFICKKCRLSK